MTHAIDTPGMRINPENAGDTDPAIATVRGHIALIFFIFIDV
jgi:hypothetical protein